MSHHYVYAPFPNDHEGSDDHGSTFPRRQNLTSPRTTPIIQVVVGQQFVAQNPLTRGDSWNVTKPASPVLSLQLVRLFFFHLAQRARWAAAIFLRAAADMGLRTLGMRDPLDFRSSPPRLPRAANAAFRCSISPCTRCFSFRSFRIIPVRFVIVPLGQAL